VRPGSARKPLIGVSTYREEAAWGIWSTTAAVLPYDYVSAVVDAGGVPLLLPPMGGEIGQGTENADAAVSVLDGLLLSGGPDIDPGRYGADPHPRTADWRPERDRWELALLEAALERDLPVLGICRGAQLLNVARGGSLRQHVPEDAGHEGHRPEPAVYGTTTALLEPDALPGRLLGPSVEVPCYHHQSIGALGSGLTVTGRSADGTVEAVELAGREFVFGVQWHPEVGEDPRLFEGLVAAARNRSGAREWQQEQERERV
jgi:gamma-glutamyl-gamma-aminobutyrate hydrolase PuuD